MHYILLAILSSTVFAAALKISELKNRDRSVVALFNYLCGMLAAAVYWALFADVRLSISPVTAIYGALSGAAWVAGLLTMMASIRLAGVALTSTFGRLSVVMPLFACVFYWSEELNTVQWAGVGLALVAVVLISSRASGMGGKFSAVALLVLAAQFVSQGVSAILTRAFDKSAGKEEISAYMLVIFITASVLMSAYVLFTRKPVRTADAGFGVAIGIPNLLSGSFTVLALNFGIGGSIVFMVTSVGAIVTLAVMGVLIWKEKLALHGIVGILLAVVALVLINLIKI
jgi:drug/metabolite transporter (DMT)-like permease